MYFELNIISLQAVFFYFIGYIGLQSKNFTIFLSDASILNVFINVLQLIFVFIFIGTNLVIVF